MDSDQLDSLRQAITTVHEEGGVDLSRIAKEAGVAYATLRGLWDGTTAMPRKVTVRAVERAVRRLSPPRPAKTRRVAEPPPPREEMSAAPPPEEMPAAAAQVTNGNGSGHGNGHAIEPVREGPAELARASAASLHQLIESSLFAGEDGSMESEVEIVERFGREALAWLLRKAGFGKGRRGGLEPARPAFAQPA